MVRHFEREDELKTPNRATVKSYPELVVSMMTNKCPPIPDNLTDTAKDFIKQCCQFDKKQRPTAAELLSHPFMVDC